MIDIFIDMSTKCRGRVVVRMRMTVGFIRFKMILWVMDHRRSWDLLALDEFVLDLGQK